MSEATPAVEFAALLRELKDRSGLSYGVLAKRLHMSTSTLHRYCNGDAVPTDYAPVERMARLCKAAPAELVELHRRWVVADAARRSRASGPQDAAAGPGAGAGAAAGAEGARSKTGPGTGIGTEPGTGTGTGGARPAGASEPDERAGPAGAGEPGSDAQARETDARQTDARRTGAPETGGRDGEVQRAGAACDDGRVADAPGGARPGPAARHRTRTAVLAGAAVAAVLAGVVLAVGLPGGGADGDGKPARPAGAAGVDVPGSGTASPSPTGTPTASAPASASGSPGADGEGRDASRAPGSGAAARPSGRPGGGAAPLTVRVDPYAWESPCSQRYLIAAPPGKVHPPPVEQDATAWVAAERAVSSGEQLVRLSVQGTGAETVVVEGITVRVTGKRAPLAWNDYAMGYPGVGCGGNVPARSFTVALDAARPSLTPESGHRDFPFKVSESDPEVYYITADASAYDVSWHLELKWSSGSRNGTLVVNDKGRPFRTSGNNGRPAYEFPLGGDGWVPEGTTDLG
ncbi:helix-turn-helix domain-containing protein [Streptomyces sp. NPDC029526]|uniref:transcriptional regulator n=1 Tax=Streptomyces sp. NPDC029526 TaxID=3155728 RepID=UPI0033E1E277